MGNRFISRWLILSAFGLAGVILILFWFHYKALLKTEENTGWVNHSYTVIQNSDELLTTLINAETGERGFIITRGEEFLQPYYGSKEKATQLLDQLKELTADNLSQQTQINAISQLSGRRFNSLSRGIDFGLHDKFEEAQQLLRSGAGKHIMDSLRVAVSAFQYTEQSLLKKRNASVDRAASLSFITLSISTGVILIIVLGLLVVLYREELKRRKIEKELFISREWFSKTLLSMGDGVIATDANGVISFMNKAAESLTGWGAPNAIGKPLDFVFEIINEYTKQPVTNPVKVALTENKIVLLANHTLLIRKDKSRIYIDDSAAPIHNDQGKIIGGVLIFRDVSEQSLSRKKLAESESRLSGIMNNTTAVIYMKDAEGKYIMINKQHEKLFGIKAADIIGKTDYDFFPKEISDKYNAVDRSVILTGKTIQLEEEGVHKDGTKHTYISSKFPVYDSEGNIYAVCGVSTDITENKKAIALQEKVAMQETLLKSEAKYAELTGNMPNLFFALNSSMRIIYWNKTCETFTGINTLNAMGKTIKEVFPHLVSDIPDRCLQVLKTGEAYNSVIQFDYEEKDYAFLVNIYPTEQGLSVLMTNISEQKKAERETLELVENLQRKNKDLRQFAYIVSHNLRAPIAKIQGLSSLIGTVSGLPGSHDESDILHHITEEAIHLDNVVKDLNMIISARDSGGEIKEFISFEEQFNLIKQVLENEINDSRANITADFTALKGAMSVKSYIYSILYNLISNAVKYRSPQRPLRINIKTFKDEKYSWIIIQDNGLGIDMKRNAEKIFGLYKRFHEHVDGKGIGLHLVKTQAEALGGGVEVESTVNEGTTFKIFFK